MTRPSASPFPRFRTAFALGKLIAAATLLWPISAAAQSSVTIQSQEPGRQFRVSGKGCSAGEYVTPKTLTWAPGSACEVEFVTPQTIDGGTRFVFSGWEGETAENPRRIKADRKPATFTALFKKQHYLALESNPAGGGAVAGGGWVEEEAEAEVSAIPNDGFDFLEWTGVGARPAGSIGGIRVLRPVTLTAHFRPLSAGQALSVTIASNHANLVFTVAGVGCSPGAYSTPQRLDWAPGITCAVEFLSPQSGEGGAQLVFRGWQDGSQDNPREFNAPRRSTTFIALFERP